MTVSDANKSAARYAENIPNIYKRLLSVSQKELTAQYKAAYNQIEREMAALWAKIYDPNPTIFRNNLYKYQRYESLQKEVAGILKKLGSRVDDIVGRSIPMAYRTEYYYTSYMYDASIGQFLGFTSINNESVKAALLGHYDFRNYKDSVKTSISQLNADIKNTITQATIQGYGVKKTAEELKRVTTIAYNKSERIARTELLRASSVGGYDAHLKAVDALADWGITPTRYWMATLDDRTRPSHAAADGQKEDKEGYFKVDGVKLTAPRLSGVARVDLNCRCSVGYDFDAMGGAPNVNRYERYKSTPRAVPANITFREWAKQTSIKLDPAVLKAVTGKSQ